MIRVRFLKSVSTLTASYGKNTVAWLDESTAHSFISCGLCSEFEEITEPKIIVQTIQPEPIEPVKVQTRKKRK